MVDDAQRIRTWLDGMGTGWVSTSLTQLAGGASPRRYWRIAVEGSGATRSVVAMVMPRELVATEHGAGASTESSWLKMQAWLAEAGLPVPHVIAFDAALQLLVLEDLGDERLFDRVRAGGANRLAAYEAAVDLLVNFQRVAAGKLLPGGIPALSEAHIRAELQEFVAMGLQHRLGIELTQGERQVFARVEASLCGELQPELLSHRDFQSQNLMQTPRGLVIIDFQDAFVAPRAYDLVALLRDSYVRLGSEELHVLLERYVSTSGLERGRFVDAFHLQTIQRKLKDAGRFHTLAQRGKPGFLAYYPDSIHYVVSALESSGRFPDLLDLLRERLPEARDMSS